MGHGPPDEYIASLNFDELPTHNGHGRLPAQSYWRPLVLSEDISLYAPSEAEDVPASNNNSAATPPNAILTHSNVFTLRMSMYTTLYGPLETSFEDYFQLIHFFAQPWEPSQDRPLKITVVGRRYMPKETENDFVRLEHYYDRPGNFPMFTELSMAGFDRLTLATIILTYADDGTPWPFFLDSILIRFWVKPRETQSMSSSPSGPPSGPPF
ncbi:MAG: hypothetical protein M1837_004021 [Sclerophora amabilis]|nr:MAG: hypothetical protein M1837_004021 [Sclerophora amabilis]